MDGRTGWKEVEHEMKLLAGIDESGLLLVLAFGLVGLRIGLLGGGG